MKVFLNGRFVEEQEATVSVFDRSFLYGDGLFETLLVHAGSPFRWDQHAQRLLRGAHFLGIKLPFEMGQIERFARELISRNQLSFGLLRLTLSRGVGIRGYSPVGAERPTVVMTVHSFPRQGLENPPVWRARCASFRLPEGEALAQFKTCNKLPQIMARCEAEVGGAEEALLLNTAGYVVEGASSNLFWIVQDEVCTAPLPNGILPGVTREIVHELCTGLRLKVREAHVTREQLLETEGIFFSLSSFGVVECCEVDKTRVKQSPISGLIRDAYWRLVNDENSSLRF